MARSNRINRLAPV